MPQTQQMSAAQQNAIARAAIQARAVLMRQQIYGQTVVPGNNPTITVQPRNVGLILGFWVQIIATVNNGSAVQINPTDVANANLLGQVQFNDLQNNTRIQTSGWHLNMVNTIKARRVFGTSFVRTTGFDSPINYGANMTADISNSGNIAAAGNGTMTMWYWVPLAYTPQDLRGAVYGNVVNATMQLLLTFAGGGANNVVIAAQNGADSTLAMYVGAAAGSVSQVTISSAIVNVWQEYYDQLPMGPNGVLLPIQDLATIYELKNTIQSAISVGQDFPYQYSNFRNFLSTIMGYVNNGTTGARGNGSDINYLALQSANFTNLWKVAPALQSLLTRQKIGVDMPPGFYYFDTREKPINTTQYGNMQLILNPATATNNPYQLIGVEDFALVQTLSMAGSLAAS